MAEAVLSASAAAKNCAAHVIEFDGIGSINALAIARWRWIVARQEVAVKKYVVELSEEERARLDDFVRRGKRAAHLPTKARILLKADVSEAGEMERRADRRGAGHQHPDDRGANAIWQLVGEGFVLTRKKSRKSAPRRIFDGAAEAKA